MNKKHFTDGAVLIVSLLVALCFTEGLLRLKNANQSNYTIEMWRYAKELKIKSDDPLMGHEHRPGRSAKLQNVFMRLNSLGLRGPEIKDADLEKKKIIFLGSSNTLGWGVDEDKVLSSLIQKSLGDDVLVLNAGIGNYNALRYVRLFKSKLRDLRPDIVVVHYFINDAKHLESGRGNFLLLHSQLAVMIDQVIQISRLNEARNEGLIKYYKDIYSAESQGYQEMINAFNELQEMSKADGFKVVLAVTPESHFLKNFPFENEHAKMKVLAASLGWTYIDFTDELRDIQEEKLWVMPSDPHYNALGHEIMARVLLPVLRGQLQGLVSSGIVDVLWAGTARSIVNEMMTSIQGT